MGNYTMQKVDRLIRAKAPVVAINTPEEQRVLDEMRVLAKVQGKRLIVWSVAIGFQQLEPSTEPAVKSPDPLSSLMRVIADSEQPTIVPTLYVFCDLAPYFKAPQIARALRDVAHRVKSVKGITVILLGAHIEVGEDSKKEVAIVDFPLPVAEELKEQVEAFVASLPAGFPVQLSESETSALIVSLKGLTQDEADGVLSQAAIANRALDARAVEYVMEAKAQIIKASGALEFYPAKVGYNEIGGLDLLKGWARQAEKSASAEAKAFGVEAPKGLLLVGVPGCGKSLTAKAIAGNNRPLVRLDAGALFGGLVGQSEAQTRNALKIAEAVSPCVLWIDEIEKGFGSRGDLDGGASSRVFGTILTWMQEQQGDVFVVATANDVSGIRPELIRRFPVKFFVDLPQGEERAEILGIHLEKRGRKAGDFDLVALAELTDGFTGSELEEVVQGALMAAFGRGAADVEAQDLVGVIAQTVPLATTMKEQIAEMRKWAERARPASSRQDTGHRAGENSEGRGALLEF